MASDFLGQTYDVDDYVIYGATSGRSVNMVLGRVVKFNPSGSVTIQGLAGSRWEQHSKKVRYKDSRTGKFVDRWCHVKAPAYWLDPSGNALTNEEKHEIEHQWWRQAATYGRYGELGLTRVGLNPADLKYVRCEFEDYIEEVVDGPSPVTLSVTENIVRWHGALPEGL